MCELPSAKTPTHAKAFIRMGSQKKTVAEVIETTHRGWLCEADSRIVGFAMANGETGELSIIAVLPEYEMQGIGSKLLLLAEGWLSSVGWRPPWILASKLTLFIAIVGGRTLRFKPIKDS